MSNFAFLSFAALDYINKNMLIFSILCDLKVSRYGNTWYMHGNSVCCNKDGTCQGAVYFCTVRMQLNADRRKVL